LLIFPSCPQAFGGQTGPESITQQTSTQSERTERPFTRHREPEMFETDTETKTKQETEPEETEPKQHKSEEELTNKLKRLQMMEPKEPDHGTGYDQPEEQNLQCLTHWRPQNFYWKTNQICRLVENYATPSEIQQSKQPQ
jgi:hypothetical protein